MTDELTAQSQRSRRFPWRGNNCLLPAATFGKINVAGDEDWFRFDAVNGTTYRIETSLLSLPDSVLYLIHTDGETVVDFNDDDGPEPESAIIWTANATGSYYARVVGKDPDAHTGTYLSASLAPPGPVRRRWRRGRRQRPLSRHRLPAYRIVRRRG